MYDLIWIGNSLYPRWIVFGVVAAIPIIIVIIVQIIRH